LGFHAALEDARKHAERAGITAADGGGVKFCTLQGLSVGRRECVLKQPGPEVIFEQQRINLHIQLFAAE